MDFLQIGGMVTDIVTGISSAKTEDEDPGKRPVDGKSPPRPEPDVGSSGKGALIVCIVAFVAVFAIAAAFLFSPSRDEFLALAAGKGRIDVLGWFALACFAFPVLGLPRAIASLRNRAVRLACALAGVTLVFGVALAAIEAYGLAG